MEKNEGSLEMVRVTPARNKPVSAFIFILSIEQKFLKTKRK